MKGVRELVRSGGGCGERRLLCPRRSGLVPRYFTISFWSPHSFPSIVCLQAKSVLSLGLILYAVRVGAKEGGGGRGGGGQSERSSLKV